MNALRGLALAAVVLSLAACAGNRPKRVGAASPPTGPVANDARKPPETSQPQDRRYAQDQDGEPDRTIDITALPVPEPRAEPRSKYGNRSPYTVLGESYEVLPTAKGYVERGIASWYGAKFHGYMTSSFEPYDMYAFSAAHKTLPLPSWVRVTNLANGKSVTVRVNDRGPFHQNRIIDLSYAAAARIGIWPAGTGMVEVRAVGPDDAPDATSTSTVASHPRTMGGTHSPPRAGAAAAALPAGTQVLAAAMPAPTAPLSEAGYAAHSSHLYVQVGAYGEAANAQRAADALSRARLGEVQIVDATVAGRHVRRVRLGPLPDAESAEHVVGEVRRLGLGNPQVAAD